MESKSALKEGVWATLGLSTISAVFVTVVGYFDEGNFRLFASFWEYLVRGGVPPLSDYVLWAIIFFLLGISLFYALAVFPGLRKSFAFRLVVALFSIPIFILSLLSFLTRS